MSTYLEYGRAALAAMLEDHVATLFVLREARFEHKFLDLLHLLHLELLATLAER